ncbi:SDR family oxidoreductase [Zavarzinia sp.]|uniref:SDR family oxidoreductase n=1 Tax=Zavarzinia sp. TaxID=2027920 RepID=UPI0035630F5C
MRVFVTGASGFVGSAVVRELLAAGHAVLGLARSDQGAATVAALGAEVHRGDLDDSDSLRRGAAAADGVIHTAFNHDFSTFADNCEADRGAIAALADGLDGSARPLIVTSGTGILPQGHLASETTTPAAGAARHPRTASEEAADAARARGANVSVMRLPPSVHGQGDHGFVPLLIGLARQKGVAAYAGMGDNRWAAVHRLDAARLFRLALENPQPGARYHAVAEEGVPFRALAEAIGRRLSVPVTSLAPAEAQAHFGWFAHFAALDVPASSAWTRERFAWQPEQPGLLADLDQPCYFEG